MSSFHRRHLIYRYIRENHRQQVANKRKALRASTDPFDVPNEEFRQLYRLPKDLCLQFISEISPHMETSKRVSRLPKALRVLVALRFLAHGNYQRSLGKDAFLNVSQSAVSRCVKEVVTIMSKHFVRKYVRFPIKSEDSQRIKRGFYQKYHFPGVIGAISGFHIKIRGQSLDIAPSYVCRKGGHSINVQIICDLDLRILNCNARFGGATCNASVWRASALRAHFRRKYSAGDRNFWILGDNSYPQLPYIMTPIRGDNLTEDQEIYNAQHRKARNCVKRCCEVLKSRFRCLNKPLCYDPMTAGKIINSCIVLHNMMIENNVEMDDQDDPIYEVDYGSSDDERDENESYEIDRDTDAEGVHIRNLLIRQYFSDS